VPSQGVARIEKKKMVCARNSIYGKPTKYKNKISFVNPLDGWINGSLFKRRKKAHPQCLVKVQIPRCHPNRLELKKK